MYSPPVDMFVLLEHDPTREGAAERECTHWDLLLAVPGAEKLWTWRLAADPCEFVGGIATERNLDHDRRFWADEGPLRSAPGRVRRVDRGTVQIIGNDAEAVVFELAGERLRGRWVIRPPAGTGVLEAVH
jgi:hypothetical protein